MTSTTRRRNTEVFAVPQHRDMPPRRPVSWVAVVICVITFCLTMIVLAFLSLGDTSGATTVTVWGMLLASVLAFITRDRWS
jgi:quinol-cytochrome oxidoreductase complex cytochrome b subunit